MPGGLLDLEQPGAPVDHVSQRGVPAGVRGAAVTPTAPAATDVRKWAAGQTVRVGDQRWHDGELFTVIQAHTTQSDWAPTATPALWKQHRADLAAWVQPTGASDAYPQGAKVAFNGRIYESKIAANVWSPTVYPAGWTDLGPA